MYVKKKINWRKFAFYLSWATRSVVVAVVCKHKRQRKFARLSFLSTPFPDGIVVTAQRRRIIWLMASASPHNATLLSSRTTTAVTIFRGPVVVVTCSGPPWLWPHRRRVFHSSSLGYDFYVLLLLFLLPSVIVAQWRNAERGIGFNKQELHGEPNARLCIKCGVAVRVRGKHYVSCILRTLQQVRLLAERGNLYERVAANSIHKQS